VLVAAIAQPAAAALTQPLPRFPTVSASSVAFVALGNLGSVPRRGSAAKRLTADPGQVLVPHFSPDDRSIAFSWRREGGTDVYVRPTTGGVPVRLTHGPTLDTYDNSVTGWTLDGADILFVSHRLPTVSSSASRDGST